MRTRVNNAIRISEVRLIDKDGQQIGVVPTPKALDMARSQGLDLVEISPNVFPPVAKIMDYGKFQYDQTQKKKQSRKNQVKTVIKEVRFRLKIDTHDYETKLKQIQKFLFSAGRVKIILMLRGRELQKPALGIALLEKIANELKDISKIETKPLADGRNMTMILIALKNQKINKQKEE